MKNADFRLEKPHSTSQSFVVRMTMEEDGTTRVLSCELVHPKYRNKISFREGVSPSELFVPDVAEAILVRLENLSMGTEVWSLPTLAIEVPGLTLAKAHLMVSQSLKGDLSIIFRFSFFYGDLDCAFLEEVSFKRQSGDQCERLAAEVLSDLALPLMNICHAASKRGDHTQTPFNKFGRDLAIRADELQFQIELVKRYIERRKPLEDHPKPRRMSFEQDELLYST